MSVRGVNPRPAPLYPVDAAGLRRPTSMQGPPVAWGMTPEEKRAAVDAQVAAADMPIQPDPMGEALLLAGAGGGMAAALRRRAAGPGTPPRPPPDELPPLAPLKEAPAAPVRSFPAWEPPAPEPYVPGKLDMEPLPPLPPLREPLSVTPARPPRVGPLRPPNPRNPGDSGAEPWPTEWAQNRGANLAEYQAASKQAADMGVDPYLDPMWRKVLLERTGRKVPATYIPKPAVPFAPGREDVTVPGVVRR